MSNGAGNQAMTTLEAQWYNSMVNGLHLNPDTYLMLQPNTPIGNTSDKIWAYFNAIPPASLNFNLNTAQFNQFYTTYEAVVNQLKAQTALRVQRDLADCYQPWMSYVKALNPLPTPEQLPNTFRSWAAIYCPDHAAQGYTDYQALIHDPVSLAQQYVLNQTGFLNNTPNFNQTIDDLNQADQIAPAGGFTFDSATASSDVTNTWAKGSISGFYDFFSGSASVDWSSLNAKASSSQVTVDVQFQHVFTFTAQPGAWYNAGALGMAFQTQDNTLWNPGTPNWNSTFGPSGDMQRLLTSLVIVDGITTKITSAATYSTQEQQQINADLSVGIWPFFSLGASGGYSHSAATFDGGQMTVTGSSVNGNPIILGANVTPVGQIFTQPGALAAALLAAGAGSGAEAAQGGNS
ncbi:MAG TPA: hypothetical protein VH482_19810 [Thermomicrobiales bacterium]|jgi:hypothetical protein